MTPPVRSKTRRAQPTSNFYAHINLFVGKYRVPADGHIKLDVGRIRLMAGREEADGWHQRQTDETEERWLIIEEFGFWPVMVRLNLDDLRRLRAALNDVSETGETALKGN